MAKRYTINFAAWFAAVAFVIGAGIAAAQETQPEPTPPADQPAAAQPAEQRPVEEIVVTGSRIKRTDIESISPITVLSELELENAGNLTIEDTLQELPAVTGGDFGSSVNNGSDGIATVSLRGLGPNRTLVLIDGHRPGPAGVDGLVDLNLIPAAMIERVEVLRDGASTIYGSDAVGGVVNIITKKDFEGVKLDLGYDITSYGDGDQYNAALTFGKTFDEGRFVVGAQWTKRQTIWQGDRNFSECQFQDLAGDGNLTCGGSSNTAPARINSGQLPSGIPDDPATPAREDINSGPFIVDRGNNTVRDLDFVTDLFNFQAFSYMVTPQDVFSFFGSAEYEIAETALTTVSAYADIRFAKRESDQLLAAEATFWTAPVPTNNPYSPWSDNSAANSLGLGCGSAANPTCVPGDPDVGERAVGVRRRLTDAPGRNSIQDADGWNILGGFKGEFSNGIGWDISYSYGDYLATMIEANRGNVDRFATLLDPAACAADSACATAVAGVPGGTWDPFREETFTPAMQEYALLSPNEVRRSKLRIIQLNANGESEEMFGFALPGGPIRWAAGYEYRKEDSRADPDGSAILGQVFFFAGFATRGVYSVHEQFAELELPLLAEVPFVYQLNLNASVRHSDYSSVGDATNVSTKLEWAPTEDARLRFVWTQGFRAPNIGELFGPPTPTADDYSDPCDNFVSTRAPGDVIFDNCASDGLLALLNTDTDGDGVDDDWTNALSQAEGRQIGNEDLKPEDATSYTVGLVLTPRFLEGFSLTVDWFKIDIDQAIGTAGTQNIIDLCYASPGFSSPLCAFIPGPTFVNLVPLPGPGGARRDDSETNTGIDLTNQNLATFTTKGIDFDARYGFDIPIGRIDLRVVGTWLDEFTFQSCTECPVTALAGNFGTDPYFGIFSAFPEWQFNPSIGFSRDNWGVAYTIEYMSAVDELSSSPGFDSVAGSRTYHDIAAWYEIGRITVRAGVRNISDKNPPFTTNNNDMNTIPISYRTAGRYLYARASVAF